MIYILFITFFSCLFSQIIDHQISREIFRDLPFEVQVYSDYDPSDIAQFNIYYKSNKSDIFSKSSLNKGSNNYYSVAIPATLIQDQYFEYYILLETNDGTYKTIPDSNPHDVPISLLVLEEDTIIDDFKNSGLDIDVNIISPQPNQIIEPSDVFIALSYFRVDDIDLSNSQILIDDENMNHIADLRQSNLTLVPKGLSPGKHQIKVILFNNFNQQYTPVIWNFYISGNEYKYTEKRISGKVWNDYINNEVDTLNSYSNSTNFNFDYSDDWIKIKSRLKKSSLENSYTQAKDRYTFDLDLNNLKIKYGDFYPNINNFLLSGNRVRGLGFNYKSDFFQIDLISGELARSIQGKPNESVIISDYMTDYICTESDAANPDQCISGYDKDYINISRTGYTFKRDISGLRIGLGRRMNFGFNILKAKDDINSVDKNIGNAIVTLPYELEIFENFNSDQFIDMDDIEGYSAGDQLTIDYNQNGEYDDLYLTINDIELSGYDISNIYYSNRKKIENLSNVCIEVDQNDDCITYETYPLIQYVWEIKIENHNLESFLEQNYGLSNNDANSLLDQQVFLDKQWDGDKPEDNLVLGTDFSMQSKNKKLKFRTSFAISLLNENIWNPVKSVNEFDTYSDDYTDCEFGTTYSNVELLSEDCTDSYQNGGCNFSDHYWHDCKAYIYINGEYDLELELWDVNDDTEISLEVLEQGIALDAIPDPEDFEDIFHYNFDAIPTIPFYSLVQKAEQGESISLSDMFNAPEVAYDIDFSLNVLKSQIKFGIKQVGQSFNTFGNPYLQKDMREKYLSNRMRILENRMFLTFKFSQIINGISDDETPDVSDKYDFNISYYPGIALPSFNLAFSNYSRKSGNEELYDADINGDNNIDENDILDTRLNTSTNNFNLSVNHGFESKYKQNITLTYFSSSKTDLLINDRGTLESGNQDTTYVSPRSKNNNLGINLKTIFDSKWESNFNYSNNYFDYAQKNSSYYEKQRINTMAMSFNYKYNEKIKKIGAGLEYINGSGSLKYDQYSIKLYSDFLFLNNLYLNVVYNIRIKNIVSSPDYNNSLFKMNISYRF